MIYYKQLDTLRCISVFIVIFHHLPVLPDAGLLSLYFHDITGVDVFFVLSGFLITGILLNSRYRGIPIGRALKTFYIRRFFRIFPIYYLTILALVMVNPAHYRDYFIYDLLYISNIKMGLDGSFPSVSPHFWSLAVEEQFYLLSPLLVFITPRKWLAGLLLLITGAGIVSFFVFYNGPWQFLASRTVINLMYLGMGGVLAWVLINRKPLFDALAGAVVPVVLLYTALVLVQYAGWIRLDFIPAFFVKFVFCVFLVIGFTAGFGGMAGKIIGWAPFVYLGRISYGLYLYHFLMVIPLSAINRLSLKMAGYDMMANPYMANVYKIMLTVLVAAVSWKLVEQPASRLKEKFAYR